MKQAGAAVAALFFVLVVLIVGGTPASQGGGGGGLQGVPPEYEQWVLQAGSICPEIPPALIAAQIEAESGWNPTVTSHAGAAGISQFMPSTWAAVGRDGDGDGKADVLNPADAIITQGHYMCGQLEQVKRRLAAGVISGDPVDLTLAAYNAGLGSVEKYGGIPPFTETQNYVRHIRELIAKYEAPTGVAVAGAPINVGGGLVYPLPQRYPITSPFGWRWHPVRGGNVHHDGTDYGAPCGTPVLAVRAGRIAFTGWWGSGGNAVEIDHGGGFTSHYLHLSDFATTQGATVQAGQVIGYVGTTGGSTGCHLHLGFEQNGNYVDPETYIH